MNKSVMKCCICNNENIGQFITINNKKYHLCCIEQLQQENQRYKEVIDNVSNQIKLYGRYNGEKCTRGFSMMIADFNKLLDILKEVSE